MIRESSNASIVQILIDFGIQILFKVYTMLIVCTLRYMSGYTICKFKLLSRIVWRLLYILSLLSISY